MKYRSSNSALLGPACGRPGEPRFLQNREVLTLRPAPAAGRASPTNEGGEENPGKQAGPCRPPVLQQQRPCWSLLVSTHHPCRCCRSSRRSCNEEGGHCALLVHLQQCTARIHAAAAIVVQCAGQRYEMEACAHNSHISSTHSDDTLPYAPECTIMTGCFI